MKEYKVEVQLNAVYVRYIEAENEEEAAKMARDEISGDELYYASDYKFIDTTVSENKEEE